jgi:hypothetical protein
MLRKVLDSANHSYHFICIIIYKGKLAFLLLSWNIIQGHDDIFNFWRRLWRRQQNVSGGGGVVHIRSLTRRPEMWPTVDRHERAHLRSCVELPELMTFSGP